MLKEILANITIKEREQLDYALENDITQIIDIGNGTFIGVNVVPNGRLTIQESNGSWSLGVIHNASKSNS